LIDGASSVVMNNDYASITVVSTGTAWVIV
jgi:hypothetical protein